MDKIFDALTEMKTDIGSIKQDVEGIKQDVEGIKQDVAGVKQELAEVKQEVKALDGRLSCVEEKVDTLGVTVKENSDMIKALMNRTDMIDAKIDGLTVSTASTKQVQAVRQEFGERLRGIGQAFMKEALEFRHEEEGSQGMERKAGSL